MEDSSVQRLRANRCGIGSLYRMNDDSLSACQFQVVLKHCTLTGLAVFSPQKTRLEQRQRNHAVMVLKLGYVRTAVWKLGNAKTASDRHPQGGNQATRKPPVTDAPKTSSDSSLVLYNGHQTTLRCFVVILLVE
jgi:hypothetical protein